MEDSEDTGVAVQTASGPQPLIEVEILPDVHAYIDGELVEPGETCLLDPACAINLVAIGHGRIVGSA